MKLVDVSGAEVASYEYDAWGNVLLQSGSMAGVNPLRYRGYYHDSETGFYYLQSRYYDPATRRFINADSYASTDSKEPLNKSSAALSGPFAPTDRFENLEIRKGFLRFSNLNLEQNPSLTALAI